MTRLEPPDAQLLVFTFKEGLLSAMAHDLKLQATRFSVEVSDDETRVSATIDAASLQVVSCMKDGAENPHGLPALVFGEIERNMGNDVLRPGRFPTITFVSDAVSATELRGQLTLCGQTRPVRLRLEQVGDRVIGRARLDQREFGIKPYSAMMGTLKIRPEVDIEVSLSRSR